MTIVYIVGHLLEANQSIMHGTWLLPQVFSTGTRIPHGVCAVPTLILVQPSSGGDDTEGPELRLSRGVQRDTTIIGAQQRFA